MRRISIAFITIAIALPLSIQAQETPAEQEAWDALVECSGAWDRGDLETGLACTHDDFVGWRLEDPVPRTKESSKMIDLYLAETSETKASALRPLSVKVYGNMAIIHYYYMGIVAVQGGEDERITYRWTDIMIKEDGKWQWIADHGGSVSGN